MQQSITQLMWFYGRAVLFGILVAFNLFVQFIKSPLRAIKTKARTIPPKCLSHPEVGTHSYITVNGVKIHYVEAGDRSKPMMLFVHGFPEFWYCWRYQIKEFSKDYWCVALDMKGYGDSDKPKGIAPYRLLTLVEDLRQFIEQLDHNGCVLVAHDWGGAISWVLLDNYPHLVDKYIILNAPHYKVYGKLMATNDKQRRMAWYVSFFQLPYLPELSIRFGDYQLFEKLFPAPLATPEDVEAYKYIFSQSGALTSPLNYYRSIPFNKMEKIPILNDSHPPGLFIFGADDAYLVSDSVQMTAAVVPNLTTKLVRNIGHFIQQEIPNEVNEMMRRFLKG